MDNQTEETWRQRIIEVMPDIRRWIHRFTQNADDTEEIMQQSMVSALQHLVDFTEPFNLKAWLMTIARNQCMTHFREHRKHAGKVIGITEHHLIENSDEPPEEDKVVETMRNLPPGMKYLLFMKYFTKHEIAEISRLLKIPEGSVKRRLFEARNCLRKEMTMSGTDIRTAPIIRIVDVEVSTPITVRRSGVGLLFGSPMLDVGDTEYGEQYEYPGRVFSYAFQSRVTRRAIVLGQEVWEVHNTYENRMGEIERLQYFTVSGDTLVMPIRIFHMRDPDEVRVDIDPADLIAPTEIAVTAPGFSIQDGRITRRDVVDIDIDNVRYERCIRICTSEDDYHGRTYSESIIEPGGREVLSRTYISQNWKMGGFVTWDKWIDAPEIEFHGERFRLWMEQILVKTENKSDGE